MRTRVGKSLGLYAFRTKPSDLLEKASEYRMNAECKRYDLIARTADTKATMVCAGECTFNPEEYMKWAPDLYDMSSNVRKAVWSPDYWMLRNIEYNVNKRSDYIDMERVYDEVAEKNPKMYVPIRWTTGQLSETEIKIYLRELILKSGRFTVPLYYYAIRRYNGRMILYAKRSWLETFKVGQDLVNIYRMSKNIKKVYGFI